MNRLMHDVNYYYIEYQGDWSPFLCEVLINSYGALGVEEFSLDESRVDKVLGEESFCGGDLPPELMDKLEKYFEKNCFKIYFEHKDEAGIAEIFLKNEVKGSICNIVEKRTEDWNNNWKKYYKKVSLLSGVIEIIPSWEEVVDKKNLTIKINPGQGFGTGTHETTQLCLEWLINLKYHEVLDFGCGSGILGIGAQLNNNAKCTYYDIDANALGNCEENLALNHISKNFKITYPENKNHLTESRYDLVFANILAPVLIGEAIFLKELQSKSLILSGLLVEQKEFVLNSYQSSYHLIGENERNGWVSLLLEKIL